LWATPSAVVDQFRAGQETNVLAWVLECARRNVQRELVGQVLGQTAQLRGGAHARVFCARPGVLTVKAVKAGDRTWAADARGERFGEIQ
jgi:hypothetical protein